MSEEILTQNQGVDKYSVIKHSQLKWVKSQSSTVKELWIDCWLADSFGDRCELLETDIDINSSKFRTAKKVLSDNQIFTFEAVYERLPNGQNKLIGWKVKNCCNVKQLKHTTKRETKGKQVVQILDKVVQKLDKPVQKLDNLEAETVDTTLFDFPSISFSIQEKEIKNKEKTAMSGPDRKPKLKKEKNYLRPRQIGGVNFDLVTAWEQIQHCLSTIKSSYYVNITWKWEEIADFVELYIAEGKITREDFEEMKLDCSFSYVSQEYNSVKWQN